jgi:hypothetical protein
MATVGFLDCTFLHARPHLEAHATALSKRCQTVASLLDVARKVLSLKKRDYLFHFSCFSPVFRPLLCFSSGTRYCSLQKCTAFCWLDWYVMGSLVD